MSRARQEMSTVAIPLEYDVPPPPPSRCAKFLYYAWKFCSVIFSHFIMICLVIAYCILGAFTFRWLEADHEKQIKRSISWIRGNVTHGIWSMTQGSSYLRRDAWTGNVSERLKSFENDIFKAMKQDGWDGAESTDNIQWTFTGALFYSIIVITTIGYGHIAPKTQTGKVVTIFYAILGIPLMLLCLSSIGDVMASSFRFLYWRVCCYVCTRPPKRRRRQRALSRHPSVHRSVRGRNGGSGGGGGGGRASTRRRRAGPHTAPPPLEAHSYSDTEYRYRDSGYATAPGSGRRRAAPGPALVPHRDPPAKVRGLKRARSCQADGERSPVQPNIRPGRGGRYVDDGTAAFPKISLPLEDLQAALYELEEHDRTRASDHRSKSLPRAAGRGSWRRRRYDQHDDDRPDVRSLRDVDYENYRERQAQMRDRRCVNDFDDMECCDDEDVEFDQPRDRRQYDRESRWERGHSEYYDSRADREYPDCYESDRGRRARSMMYEERRGYDEDIPPRREFRRLDTRDETARRAYRYSVSPERRRRRVRSEAPPVRRRDWEDEWSDLGDELELPGRRKERPPAWATRQSELPLQGSEHANKAQIKPVPIWLCVFLVVSYVIAGAFLFHKWESWPFLDSAYFCFITLTTIGFGDFVPATGIESKDAAESIALCSLYLLFGISLLAMSFNLVQEEVIASVRAVAKKLGIIKSDGESEDSERE